MENVQPNVKHKQICTLETSEPLIGAWGGSSMCHEAVLHTVLTSTEQLLMLSMYEDAASLPAADAMNKIGWLPALEQGGGRRIR